MKHLSVTLGLILCALVSSHAMADSQYYWTCLDQSECKKVVLTVNYSPPVDVNLTCQNANGAYLPKSIAVKSQNLYVSCDHGGSSGEKGFYKYRQCVYAGTDDPTVHHFNIHATVSC